MTFPYICFVQPVKAKNDDRGLFDRKQQGRRELTTTPKMS